MVAEASLSSVLTRVARVGDCSSFEEVGDEVGALAWAGVSAGAVDVGNGTGAGASAAVGAAAAGVRVAATGVGDKDAGDGAGVGAAAAGLSTLNKLIILWI